MQPELTIIALSLWMIVVFAVTAVVYSMVFIWKRFVASAGLLGALYGSPWPSRAPTVILSLLAGYVQKARSLEKVTNRVETVATGKLFDSSLSVLRCYPKLCGDLRN